jgi:hypothetical protein
VEGSIALVALVARLAGRGVLPSIGGEAPPDIVGFAELPLLVPAREAFVALVRFDQLALTHRHVSFAGINNLSARSIRTKSD